MLQLTGLIAGEGRQTQRTTSPQIADFAQHNVLKAVWGGGGTITS